MRIHHRTKHQLTPRLRHSGYTAVAILARNHRTITARTAPSHGGCQS